ncbi:hypothetical protein HaLaN_03558 [Haematococcus lacustris]|uniref:Uncharacterized protein n=1 Tax=Haematococcus lacustris TaxID=44745 RepID=A0A699YH81_HAELA|nr:hypothetical protein HaLaN_03558 [Haematococcus lacustris]
MAAGTTSFIHVLNNISLQVCGCELELLLGGWSTLPTRSSLQVVWHSERSAPHQQPPAQQPDPGQPASGTLSVHPSQLLHRGSLHRCLQQRTAARITDNAAPSSRGMCCMPHTRRSGHKWLSPCAPGRHPVAPF